MGVILCSHHGRQGITFACAHVKRAVVGASPLPRFANATADFDGLTFEAVLCDLCAADATADGLGLQRVGDDGLDWFFGLTVDPLCVKCLQLATAS